MDDDVVERFDEAKRANVGQLLLKAARLLDERALARIRALPGAPELRPAHTRLFPHISFEGIRATEIAERLGVTKQAVAPLVADLVRFGAVELVPDPRDGRARLIRWTPQGVQHMHHGLGVLAAFEGELRDVVGAQAMATLHQVLAAWVELLSEER